MRRVLLAAVALVWILCPARSPASVVVPMTTEDLAAVSTIVVDGTITTLTSRVDTYPSGHRSVNTHARIKVLDGLKGVADGVQEINIVNPGGQLGTRTSYFPGAPKLQPGTRAVFFLWKNPFGEYRIVGLTQGMKIVKNAGDSALVIPSTGQSKPGEDEDDHDSHDHAAEHAPDAHEVGPGGMPLVQFKNLVKAYLAAFEGVEVTDPVTGEPLTPTVNPLLKPWLEEK